MAAVGTLFIAFIASVSQARVVSEEYVCGVLWAGSNTIPTASHILFSILLFLFRSVRAKTGVKLKPECHNAHSFLNFVDHSTVDGLRRVQPLQAETH